MIGIHHRGLISMSIPLPEGNEVTRGSVPIRSGVGGPVIGEVVSLYSDGEYLMGNCILNGKHEAIMLALAKGEGIPWQASYVVEDDTTTGIPYLVEDSSRKASMLSIRTVGNRVWVEKLVEFQGTQVTESVECSDAEEAEAVVDLYKIAAALGDYITLETALGDVRRAGPVPSDL